MPQGCATLYVRIDNQSYFMPRVAANLSLRHTELPFLERFEAAAKDGFDAVEYLFPYTWPSEEMVARLKGNALRQVLFNAPPGNYDGGERGLACLPGLEAEFRVSIDQALRYAHALECPRIHVMAGLLPVTGERAMCSAPMSATCAGSPRKPLARVLMC
jgi:hydroxypyruvate isomerase